MTDRPIPIVNNDQEILVAEIRPGAVIECKNIIGWLRDDGRIYKQPFLTMQNGNALSEFQFIDRAPTPKPLKIYDK